MIPYLKVFSLYRLMQAIRCNTSSTGYAGPPPGSPLDSRASRPLERKASEKSLDENPNINFNHLCKTEKTSVKKVSTKKQWEFYTPTVF